MRAVAIAAMVLALAGCVPSADDVRSVAVSRGAELTDNLVADALFILCRGASIGSIRRAFGDSQRRADAYYEMCREPTVAVDLKQ